MNVVPPPARRPHSRLIRRGLLGLVLGGTLLAAWAPDTSLSSPTVTLALCRTAVQPCQREVNLVPGQTVSLDLVITDTAPSPLPLVAWEVHLKLSDGRPAVLVPVAGSLAPVQEQGDARLALDGLVRLTDQSPAQSDEASAQYFTVQNRYTGESGQLDYAVTLLRYNTTRPGPRVAPLPNPGRLILGRITVKGTAKGAVAITSGDPAVAFQIVGLAASGDLVALETISFAASLARINVDPDQAPITLLGRVEMPASSRTDHPAATPLSVSFWHPGALPAWRQGAALPVAVFPVAVFPVAVFDEVSLDGQGAFQVSDLAPPVLPAGRYDVRVKAPGVLSQLAAGVVLPPVAGRQTPTLSFGPLRYGDVNGDDVVDVADLDIVRAAFGRLAGDPVFQALADLNADQVVDGQDFSRLALSFQSRGE